MSTEDFASEGPRVLGIGLGLFILVLMWSFTLLTLLACSRISPALASFLVILSAIITAVAVSIPRYHPGARGESPSLKTDVPVFKIYDTMFIWRMVLVSLMVVGLMVGSVFLFKHCTQPIYAEPIRKLKIQ